MKVTIVTFEPEIKHLPIVVKGGHGEAVNHLNSKYDFSYLLPVGAWPYLELQEHPSLSYLASVQIIGARKAVKVATLNTVTLIEQNPKERATEMSNKIQRLDTTINGRKSILKTTRKDGSVSSTTLYLEVAIEFENNPAIVVSELLTNLKDAYNMWLEDAEIEAL